MKEIMVIDDENNFDWLGNSAFTPTSIISILGYYEDYSDNITMQYFFNLIQNYTKELNLTYNEKWIFYQKICDCIHNRLNIPAEEELCLNDLSKLSVDGCWLDEFTSIIESEAKLINANVDRNPKTINADKLFDEIFFQYDSQIVNSNMTISAIDIINNLDNLMLSNDGGVRKLAQIIKDKTNRMNNYEKQAFITKLIRLLNEKANINSNNKFELSKETINILNNDDIFGTINDIIENFDNYSVVANDYYYGSLYKVEKDNEFVILTNIDTGEVTRINLNLMTHYLPDEKKDTAIATLLSLPAEVLLDMYYESLFYDHSDEGTGGTYFNNADKINLNNYTSDVMTHETGHALANTFIGPKWIDLSRTTEFKSTFEAELKIFAQNYPQGKYEYVNGVYTMVADGPYFTKNSAECFAECYTLLTLGTCGREMPGRDSYDGLLKKYFPNSLKLVAQAIEFVRSRNASQRAKRSVANW